MCIRDRFHVDHVVQNRRTALSLAWYEWFSLKEWKIYCCELALSSEPQIWKFHVSFGRLRQNITSKSVPHVQHDYFSSFNPSNLWFVSLALPSSNLKLPIVHNSAWRKRTHSLFEKSKTRNERFLKSDLVVSLSSKNVAGLAWCFQKKACGLWGYARKSSHKSKGLCRVRDHVDEEIINQKNDVIFVAWQRVKEQLNRFQVDSPT